MTLLLIALALWLVVIPAAVVALVLWSKSHDDAWTDERPEWADDETPTYDALCFEFWAKEMQP
ncbi:hypothetical protein J2X46_002738 [Nocardioides sp. BE266]|uniref:hypothetical protein n=1 Tax=Nocardioides sp. BE266 TaxID=2817725 RepID=UPI0028603C36|nr:hypothetical protein [Nocardioides sp. BE266]MDR7253748.1 hypothetical protein [Nocardioides sp. BE266]